MTTGVVFTCRVLIVYPLVPLIWIDFSPVASNDPAFWPLRDTLVDVRLACVTASVPRPTCAVLITRLPFTGTRLTALKSAKFSPVAMVPLAIVTLMGAGCGGLEAGTDGDVWIQPPVCVVGGTFLTM